MPLLRFSAVSISFGDKPVLDQVGLALEPMERIALLGRNGAGKSTLMKIIAGEMNADSGEIIRSQNLTVSRLEQEVPHSLQGDIYSVVAGGLNEVGELLSAYQHASIELAEGKSDGSEMARLQNQIEAADGWKLSQKVSETLSRMKLDPTLSVSRLSGGMKRRVLLARALVSDPDVLLLDEPTNHLDVPAIEWLEEHLLGLRCCLIFITHDRSFLRKLATRILELDRGHLTDWPGNYQTYLDGKEAALHAEAQANALFDKKLALEETWIRQGIKARRTRNEGRVRALKQLRREHSERRQQMGSARMQTQTGQASGKIVIEAKNVDYSIDGNTILRNFSTTIMRGDKVGIIGPNGIGKSTLIRLMLGDLQTDKGNMHLGTNLEIAYFDQLRSALDPKLTALDNVGGGSDTVTINGKPRHIISYMQDFLFAPERSRAPITALSGGERNRLMLAKLFVQPSNLLVLDEPTNDLDVETLELLEELLAAYKGTLLLVSHDREFLDNVITDSIVFEGPAQVKSYIGGYSDWLRQRPALVNEKPNKLTTSKDKLEPKQKPKAKVKLSYKVQRELEELPKSIDKLETEQKSLHAQMADEAFYQKSTAQIAAIQDKLAKVEQELEQAFERWIEIEAIVEGES